MSKTTTEGAEMGIRTSDIGNSADILITEAIDSDARADLCSTLSAALANLASDCDLYDAVHASRSNELAEDNALSALKQVAKTRGITKFVSWVESHPVDDQRELVVATLNAIQA